MSYRPPSYYEKSIKDLNVRYYAVLESIANIFPKTKLHPDFPAYSKPFTKDMSTLNKLQTDFFLFRNDLESDMEHLDKDIRNVNDRIAHFEKENKELSVTLNSLLNSNNATYGMLHDSKLLYNQELTGNWLMFFILTGVVYKYYYEK
jgi:hypothetical protein